MSLNRAGQEIADFEKLEIIGNADVRRMIVFFLAFWHKVIFPKVTVTPYNQAVFAYFEGCCFVRCQISTEVINLDSKFTTLDIANRERLICVDSTWIKSRLPIGTSNQSGHLPVHGVC